MRKKILSLIVTIGLATSISMPIFAEPLSYDYGNQNNQLEKQRVASVQAQSKVEDMQISIEKLDSNIEKIYEEMDKAKVKIGDTQKKIDIAAKDIQVAEANIVEEEDLFNKRMRSMYMNGLDSYLEMILNSDGLSDLISRVESIKKIIEFDNEIIGELKDKKSEIVNQRVALETEKTKLILLNSDNENKLVTLKGKKKAQGLLISQAKDQERLYSNITTEAKTIVNVSIKQINQIKEKAPKYTPSRGSSSLSSNAIVAYASNFLGTPYAWGANGPSNFDCSGFVKYVYAHFGVSLGRSTTSQVNDGSYVARENLQPGDLIFFGAASDPHHVGMYVGNNSYIHSPNTGDVVKISALTRSDYLTARRVK